MYSFSSSFVTTFSFHSSPLGRFNLLNWSFVLNLRLGFIWWPWPPCQVKAITQTNKLCWTHFYGSNSFCPWGHGLQFHAYKTYFSTQNHAIQFTHITTSISLDKTFSSFSLEFNSQGPFLLVDIVSFSYPLHPSMDHILTQLDIPTHFSWMDLCAFIPSTLLEAFQSLTFTFQSWCPYQHSIKLVLSCNKNFGFKSLGKIEQ
jgi:hypothetical protein